MHVGIGLMLTCTGNARMLNDNFGRMFGKIKDTDDEELQSPKHGALNDDSGDHEEVRRAVTGHLTSSAECPPMLGVDTEGYQSRGDNILRKPDYEWKTDDRQRRLQWQNKWVLEPPESEETDPCRRRLVSLNLTILRSKPAPSAAIMRKHGRTIAR